ncbi:MAG: hypothetical protein M3Q70_04105 [bacterium]|nr:hypothetical protein [bacterium]
MNEQFDQLVDYIRQNINNGIPEDHIRQTLLQHNWNSELVDRAFLSIKTPQIPNSSALAYTDSIAVSQQNQASANSWDRSSNIQPQTPDVYEQTNQLNSEPYAPEKYKVFRALSDALKAIKKNARAFFLSIVISYLIAFIFLAVITFVFVMAFYGEFNLLFASTSKMLSVLVGFLLLYTAWYALAGAYILATTSLTLYDGRENRKSSISTILSSSFSRLGRVFLANLLFSIVVFWPLVLIIFLPIIFLSSGLGGNNSSLILLPVLMLVAVIWVYVALVRFALVPLVALFEPNTPIFKTLGRSKQLLTKGGQWFLVKGFLLLILVLIILGVITGSNLQELSDSKNIAVNIFLIVLSIFVNAAIVMLYHNRKTIKG